MCIAMYVTHNIYYELLVTLADSLIIHNHIATHFTLLHVAT